MTSAIGVMSRPWCRRCLPTWTQNPHAWENDTLELFLETFAALIGSADQLMVNRGERPPVTPTWALLAELLVGASGYE